jgi:simple sugar transport system permease protein
VLEILEALLFSTLDGAPALIFAALGGVLSERAGVVNVGLEGQMRAGAFCAAVAALSMPTPLAVVVGMLAGAGLASVHGYLSIRWRSDQVVSGMAINLVALAGGTFLLESLYSPNGTPSIEQLPRWHLPLIHELPLLRALSDHPGLTYLALALPFLFHWVLKHTALGLRLRAVGE